jgi:putative transposase
MATRRKTAPNPSMSKWMPVVGRWRIDAEHAEFTEYDDKVFKIGIALSDTRTTSGVLRATVQLEDTGEGCAHFVLGYKGSDGIGFTAGIGGFNAAHSVTQYFLNRGSRKVLALGRKENLEPKKPYRLEVHFRGQNVKIVVDNVQVLEMTLPYPPPGEQVGIKGYGPCGAGVSPARDRMASSDWHGSVQTGDVLPETTPWKTRTGERGPRHSRPAERAAPQQKAGETPAPQEIPLEFTDPRTIPFVPVQCRGELPHLYKEGGSYFVTFRLRDAVAPRPSRLDRQALLKLSAEQIAELTEPPLTLGSCALRKPEVAYMVQNALRHFEGQRYVLSAWCVMPNHVHAVVTPMTGHSPSDILHSWKSFSAHRANKILETLGTFWERESFDHLIRDLEQFEGFIRYIELNPVVAGLCSKPGLWPYGSAHGRV